jgi:holliday junction DNA helicase RuvA
MIASINGILKHKSPTEIIVDVHGIGFAVHIPLSTYEKLAEPGQPVFLLTHFHIREDAMVLFGFATEEERRLFKLLISVSGIGPKIAQSILSGISVSELQNFIVQGHIQALTSIPGIGKKTAERLVVELRDKVAKIHSDAPPEIGGAAVSAVRSEAVLALVSLGFTQQAAEKAIRATLNEAGSNADLSVEELLKLALRYTGSR